MKRPSRNKTLMGNKENINPNKTVKKPTEVATQAPEPAPTLPSFQIPGTIPNTIPTTVEPLSLRGDQLWQPNRGYESLFMSPVINGFGTIRAPDNRASYLMYPDPYGARRMQPFASPAPSFWPMEMNFNPIDPFTGSRVTERPLGSDDSHGSKRSKGSKGSDIAAQSLYDSRTSTFPKREFVPPPQSQDSMTFEYNCGLIPAESDLEQPLAESTKSTNPRKKRKRRATEDEKPKSTRDAPLDIYDYSFKYPKQTLQLTLPSVTESRVFTILSMASKKGLDIGEVKQVLDLFKIRNFDAKLRLLAFVVGNATLYRSHFPRHQDDRGLIITERDNGQIDLTIKTYAGADNSENAFEGSIMECFREVKPVHIYFRQPNQPTTYKSKNNYRKETSPQKEGEPVLVAANLVKRPLNSFMLYRSMMVKSIILLSFMDSFSSYIFDNLKMSYDNYDSGKELNFLANLLSLLDESKCKELKPLFNMKKFNHHLLIQIVSFMWASEAVAVKDAFYNMADVEKSIHEKCYPGYKYRPNRKN